MSTPIEDYALIGDLHTAGLVSSSGSIDWLCLPRFDSPACFAKLLGEDAHGRWIISPDADVRRTSRRYMPHTLVLETEFETAEGAVRVVDFMPPRDEQLDVVRIVEGVRGRVEMSSRMRIGFGYGDIVPWVERTPNGMTAVGGPDALNLHSSVRLDEVRPEVLARFAVSKSEQAAFVLTWHPSHEPPPKPVDAAEVQRSTAEWWEQWCTRCSYEGEWYEHVERSLITLKALTYAPTGGVLAAPTTSLPEAIGGVRNWDYRYCWVRDATFTLQALLAGGFRDEAVAWRDWLLRAVAGEPDQLQIMYGVAGERFLPEVELS